jgi:hypothetical protein
LRKSFQITSKPAGHINLKSEARPGTAGKSRGFILKRTAMLLSLAQLLYDAVYLLMSLSQLLYTF